MAKLKYPIGIQDFREIRTKDYHYIDKTALIHRIITQGKYYFLSRPRRFGKSLLISTIKEIFQGSQDLFRNLWIDKHWDWASQCPVVHLPFSSINYQKLGLAGALSKELNAIAALFSIELQNQELKDQFRELIYRLAQVQGRVALLIDEYDKPIVDYLEAPEQAKINREILKEFYSVLKDADPHLEFVLITGVSKFSKVSIFSDLNNLRDISLTEHFNDLVGISQAELLANFSARLQEIANKHQVSLHLLLERVKNWYNGYNWSGAETLYNPFSILNFLEDGQFNNYWFATGTPTFLVERMRNAGRFKWDSEEFISLLSLSQFEIEQMDLAALLFQTGYLTLREINISEGWCKLHYPNQEVKASLEQLLLGAYQHQASSGLPTVLQLRQSLERNDLERVMNIINASFAGIPCELWRDATELHYHALVHLTFSLLSNYLRSEVHSALGRCDAIVQTPTHIYAFEFKLEQSATIAIQQILDKDYLGSYRLDTRPKIAVGINFSREKRGIAGFEWQELS